MTERGQARVYSKALVEANKEDMSEARQSPEASSRFVRLAVSPEPEHDRAEQPAREAAVRAGRRGSNASYWPEMNGFDITSGFLFSGQLLSIWSAAKLPSLLARPGRVGDPSLHGSGRAFPSGIIPCKKRSKSQSVSGSLLDLEFSLRRGEVDAVDGVGGGYFGDCIGVQVVGSEGQVLSEGDYKLVSVLL